VTVLLGIDIGGSGIKGAPVDQATGELTEDRLRIETPEPSTPEAVAAVVARICEHFLVDGPVGCTFPGVVHGGVVRTAANVDASWLDVDADGLFEEDTGRSFTVLNDADAAGLAEARFGPANVRHGVVLVLTFGTGIGSALLNDGDLVPNTELGHLELDGHVAEDRAAAAVRTEKDLSWADWGARVNRYLQHLERLFSPDLFVLGGGVSKKFDKFADQLDVPTEVVPATLRNEAGIVGATLVAAARSGA
jgi:polyphosphate glucokinase